MMDTSTIQLMVNAAIAVSIVVTNRNHIQMLKESNRELKSWLTSLQREFNELRVKVGK